MKEVRQVSGRSSESAAATARSAARQAAEDAVDRERSRIARELHDGIATDLASAISLFKTHIESHPGFGAKGGPDEILANIFGILERMLKHTRETLAELRPRPIGPEGLLGNLRMQAEEFARLYSIRVEISSNGSEDMLAAPQREVVYQIVREALTNVRRHSGSSICRVRLAFAARPFLIEVADEGRGFTTGHSGGYGLVGMRERAAGIGGRLEVVSTEGRGTTVFLFGPN